MTYSRFVESLIVLMDEAIAAGLLTLAEGTGFIDRATEIMTARRDALDGTVEVAPTVVEKRAEAPIDALDEAPERTERAEPGYETGREVAGKPKIYEGGRGPVS